MFEGNGELGKLFRCIEESLEVINDSIKNEDDPEEVANKLNALAEKHGLGGIEMGDLPSSSGSFGSFKKKMQTPEGLQKLRKDTTDAFVEFLCGKLTNLTTYTKMWTDLTHAKYLESLEKGLPEAQYYPYKIKAFCNILLTSIYAYQIAQEVNSLFELELILKKECLLSDESAVLSHLRKYRENVLDKGKVLNKQMNTLDEVSSKEFSDLGYLGSSSLNKVGPVINTRDKHEHCSTAIKMPKKKKGESQDNQNNNE